MSEKKRRDITLGEMQDECNFRGDNCETIGGDKCKFFGLCATMQTIDKGCLAPIMWNLTDPPRFNEAQMALLKALWEAGARKFIIHPVYDSRWAKFEREDRTMIALIELKALGFKETDTEYEHIYLAELLGKDAT